MISGGPAIKDFWSNLIQISQCDFRGSHTGRGGVIEIGEATLTVQPEG